MRIIDQLVYKITGDSKEAEKMLASMKKNLDVLGTVAKVTLGGVTVGAIYKVVKGLGDMAVESSVALDRVDKLSQKIGMSRKGFQEWDYVLAQSGASIEGLQMSMKTLATQAEAASSGTGESAEMFKRLGVEITDVNGKTKDQEQLFNEVFMALSDMGNETERTALAARLLGRAATELAPALNTSSEEIQGLIDQAHSLGLVYEDELVDAGVRLGDNIEALTKSFAAFKTRALAPIVSTLVLVTDKMLGQDSASGKLQGSLDKAKKATDAYKAAQQNAAGATDALSEAMVAQARAQARAAINDLMQTWKESTKEIPKLESKYNSLSKTVDSNSASLAKVKNEWASLAKEAGVANLDINKALDLSGKDLVDYIVKFSGARRMTEEYAATLVRGMIPTLYQFGKINSDIIKANQEKLDIDTKLKTAEAERINVIQGMAQAIADGDDYFVEYIQNDKQLYDSVMKSVEAIREQKLGVADATNMVLKFNGTTKQAISNEIERIKRLQLSTTNTRDLAKYNAYLNLLTEKQLKLSADEAKAAESLAEKEKSRNDIFNDAKKTAEGYVSVSKVLGDSYDLNGKQASLYTSAIEALVESGLDKEDARVRELLGLLDQLRAKEGGLTSDAEKRRTIQEQLTNALAVANATHSVTGDQLSMLRQKMGAYETAMIDLILAGQQSSDKFKEYQEQYESFAAAVNKATNANTGYIDVEQEKANILTRTMRELRGAEKQAATLGEEYNSTAIRVGILTKNIKDLIELGIDPSDSALRRLIVDLDDLKDSISPATQTIERYNDALIDALYTSAVTGDKQQYLRTAIAETERAMIELRRAGLEPTSDEYKNLQVQLDILKRQLEDSGNAFTNWANKNRDALEKTVELLGQVNSLVRIGGQIMAAQTEARIHQIDEELKARLKAEGLQEETAIERLRREYQEAVKSGNMVLANEKSQAIKRAEIEEEYAAKKKRLQREEAIRQKDFAVFQALIDGAAALIKALSTPWTIPFVMGVTAAQIALIRSQPLPSFDTGSIRIDRDKAAMVHKNEMIIPAALSEQARQEGISIAPKGKGEAIHLQVLMDSRPIIDTTVKGINSGQYGRIDARVVK